MGNGGIHNRYLRVLLLVAGLLAFALMAVAQSDTSTSADKKDGKKAEKKEVEQGPDKGEVWNGYEVHQSIEFGGHIADFSGSQAIWNTYVNQYSGPRLLNQTLDMRSLDHTGVLFDELHMSNFGYGGDPNNVTRLSLFKHKWYDFSASFRRDRNFWDYNLLANPLNPVVSNPSVPITDSPHLFEVVRRNMDFRLTLAPQSRFRVRLGYNHNVSEGPSFSSVHEGTDTVLAQRWRNGIDQYQVGFDFRFLPRTNISYDQFITTYKGDTNWIDDSFGFQLSNGTPVDLGLAFNTVANQPCAVPITNPATTPPTVSATCNAYTAYSRFSPTRNFYPTEQISFQSNYFKNVDMSGRFIYSASDSDVPTQSEIFAGFASRTRAVDLLATGPASSRRVSVSADYAITIRASDKFRIVDTFRWSNFRIPGHWDRLEGTLFSTSMLIAPNLFNPATCPGTPATCPQHNASSGADVIVQNVNRFLRQNLFQETIDLEYDLNRRVGARIGYRFRHRSIDFSQFDLGVLTQYPTLPNRGACVGQPLNPDGSCTVLTFNGVTAADVVPSFTGLEPDGDHIPINEHTALFGLWARPTDNLRFSFDVELMSADNTFTRISPRQQQKYRFRGNYKPKEWLRFAGAVNITEARNNITDIDNLQHNRNYSFVTVIAPNEKWSLDLDYNYNDIFSQSLICFAATPAPAGLDKCAASAAFLQETSFYNVKGHFVSANLMWKPVRRVTANLGYTGTFTNGDSLLLNPNAVVGPLKSNYHLPSGSLAVELARRWTGRFGWNYYGYNEKADPGFTAFRDVRGNVYTLGLKYAF
jgi:hypothetical protein